MFLYSCFVPLLFLLCFFPKGLHVLGIAEDVSHAREGPGAGIKQIQHVELHRNTAAPPLPPLPELG